MDRGAPIVTKKARPGLAKSNDDELTITEVMAELAIAERTVFRWLKDGVFPNAVKRPVRNYRLLRWRIPRADVEAYKKQVRAQAESA